VAIVGTCAAENRVGAMQPVQNTQNAETLIKPGITNEEAISKQSFTIYEINAFRLEQILLFLFLLYITSNFMFKIVLFVFLNIRQLVSVEYVISRSLRSEFSELNNFPAL